MKKTLIQDIANLLRRHSFEEFLALYDFFSDEAKLAQFKRMIAELSVLAKAAKKKREKKPRIEKQPGTRPHAAAEAIGGQADRDYYKWGKIILSKPNDRPPQI
jgi:coenzyme F420-reducing hydrogenase alpha subunit